MNNITFVVREEDMNEFRYYLQERENSEATIEKYMRDVRKFMTFAGTDQPVGKEKLLEYKESLNQFLVFLEKGRLRLRRIKVQRMDTLCMDRILDKREFQKLVRTARQQGKDQIAMIMETMCATGIRVSELKFFHVENVRNGIVRVWNKGKYRMVILPELLRKKLLLYIGRNRIRSGVIFRTRTGREKNRSNIWKEMKAIGELANISLKKAFPHNLRHLFARTFYRETKNLINLADILGHSNLDVTRGYASDGIREWKRNLEKMKLLEQET